MLSVLKKIRRSVLGRLRIAKLTAFRSLVQIDSEGFFCGRGCSTSPKNTIVIGKNFYMGNYCLLAANVNIGDDVLFASYVSLVGGDHKIDNIDCLIRESGRDELKTIEIANNVWVGHGVIIMQGVKIGSGSVVASGAVVTKDVPENAIVGGNPARLIRYRKC